MLCIIRGAFFQLFFALLLCLLSAAKADTFTITRANAAYQPSKRLKPSTIMAPRRFSEMASRRYVIVEGYINFMPGGVSSAGLADLHTQEDGDYHFEMQSTKKLRGGGINPDGLVCEISPVLRLQNHEVLRQINKNNPESYRKVRVYGNLRFGTEKVSHSGIKTYAIGNGKTIVGHWEIHPVERIESIDNKGPFQIGPSAQYKPWQATERYKLNDENFEKQITTNFARLVGTVKRIAKSTDESGDLSVSFQVNAKTYTATIPQYYVESFNPSTQTVKFVELPNFASINYSLKPSDHKRRIFHGLRDWRFRESEAFPVMDPVEMIK